MKVWLAQSGRWLRERLSMPVLRRELVESAGRKRTYGIRALALIAAAITFALFYYETVGYRSQFAGARSALGAGGNLFDAIYAMAIVGIYILLPAIVASAIAGEKERDTIVLTLVSGLRPGDIIVQKLLGRLIPMGSLLLILLPMFAVAFSLGGVATQRVGLASYSVLVTLLQVGAWAIFASTIAGTSLAAFFGTYGLLAALYFGPISPFILEEALGIYFLPNWLDEDWFVQQIPVVATETLSRSWRWGGWLWVAVIQAVTWLSILLPCVLARFMLVRRALVKPRGLTLHIFKIIDRGMNAANRLTGGVTLVKDRQSLPAHQPVAWREVSRRSLGQTRYLFRFLTLLMLPIVVILLVTFAGGGRRGSHSAEGISAWLLFMVAGGAAVLTMTAANVFVTERTHQTLAVLLTTPMTGRQIVREKLRGPFRMLLILAIATTCLLLIEAWWESSFYSGLEVALQLLGGLVLLTVLLPQFIWLGAIIGLRSRGGFTALIGSLMTAAAWVCVGPGLIALAFFINEVIVRGPLVAAIDQEPGSSIMLMALGVCSPASPVVYTEFLAHGPLRESALPAPILLASIWVVHVMILLALRRYCLRSADRWLGRVPGEPVAEAA